MLLDLSAAFDTIDHNTLLNHIVKRLGIQDTSLSWFQLYLSERSQTVLTDGCVSGSMSLLCSILHGSVLCPVVFSIYSEPICEIARKQDITVHSYADDTQLYLSFEVCDDVSECDDEIREWTRKNMLNSLLTGTKKFDNITPCGEES